MSSPIKIGLTYTGSEKKHNDYANWLKGNDDIEIVKLSAEDNNLDKVKEMDAVVLSGGLDAHPKNYGSDILDYANAPEEFNEERDSFETAVFKESQDQQLPVLGICRGMQLINCVLGGDLRQDIGTEANVIHKKEGDDKRHLVRIFDGTLLQDIVEVETDHINSAHHQAINRLGSGLMINAISDDGISEGIEWKDKKDKPFLLGVQWHPERMYMLNMQSSPFSEKIREHFLKVIKETKEGASHADH